MSKRAIEFDSAYPGITREYNFLVKNGLHFTDYVSDIKSASPLIISVTPRDVYTGVGVPKGYTSVLIRVEYNDPTRTLGFTDITEIEKTFFKSLSDNHGITLKL